MNNSAVPLALLAILIGAISLPSAPAVGSPSSPPLGPPDSHGDSPDLLLPVDVHPETNLERWAAVPVMRERTTGPAVPAYYVLNKQHLAISDEALEMAGLPVVPRHEIESTSQAQMAALAVSVEYVDEQVHEWLHGRPHESAGYGTASHPEAPIGDYTSLPVTAYVDSAEQDESGWYDDVVSSFDAADTELSGDANVYIYRFFLMQNGTPVNDVSTRCHMIQTADHELTYDPHTGVLVVVFSPGDIEGNWGWALNGPISARVSEWWRWDYCDSAWEEYRDLIPSAYVKHRPLSGLGNMQMLTAHELAHQFTMDHGDASCSGSWYHKHKTIEAFTSASNTPSSCGSNTNPFQHWHWDFTATTDGKLRAERELWTDCYNNGAC